MTGLVRSIGRTNQKYLPKEGQPPLDRKIDKAAQKVRFGPRLPPEEPVIPLPDEDAIARARRRNRSRRAGGRASTVLSGGDDDTLG